MNSIFRLRGGAIVSPQCVDRRDRFQWGRPSACGGLPGRLSRENLAHARVFAHPDESSTDFAATALNTLEATVMCCAAPGAIYPPGGRFRPSRMVRVLLCSPPNGYRPPRRARH
jgi:hypothetical protein